MAVHVGIKNKAAVDKLVSKFPAGDFAVMLFHYDGAVEQWGDLEWSRRAVHVAAPGQTKWWFAKRFLHPDVVEEYDYVFVGRGRRGRRLRPRGGKGPNILN